MFICLCDMTYVETQFNHPKLHEFMRNGQNDQKTVKCVKDFHKINTYMQRKPRIKCFIYSPVLCHTRRIQNFITS